ncbi:MAG TPA: AgmX/PglI C-terminal domain-containing protein [Myxococcales bacterium]|nr:AgmX/PglI C-terminal domain-containing protein [Myxococcales bacterium]
MVVIMKDGALVGSEVFPPGTYRMGRAPGEDLQLDDPAVSAHHASFALRNGQIGIRDDGSANGLFVNGKKVGVVRVTSKDEIQVGSYTLKMRVLEKSDPARRPPAEGETMEATVLAELPRENGRKIAATVPPPAPLDDDLTAPVDVRKPREEVARVVKRPSAEARAAPDKKKGADILTPRPIPGRGGAAAKVAPAARKVERPEPVPSARLREAEPEEEPALAKTTTPSDRLELALSLEELRKAQQAKAKAEAAQDEPTRAEPRRAAAAKAEPPAAARAKAQPQPSAKILRMGPMAVRAAAVPPPGSGKPVPAGSPEPVLRAHLVWGDAIIRAQTLQKDAKLRVGERDSLPFPLYGWPLPKKVFKLAAFEDGAWRVYVPARVEAFQIGAEGGPGSGVPSWSEAGFQVRPLSIQRDSDGEGTVTLKPGEGLRLENGRVSVELRAELPAPPVPFEWKPQMDRSVSVPFIGTFVTALAFLLFMPKRSELPDFTPKALPAIRAILQPPKKKEQAKTRLEKKAERIVQEQKEERHVSHAAARPVTHHEVALPTPQTQAIAAIQKVFRSAGTRQLFSAVSKIGRGGNGMNFKATGLFGRVPLALNGSGGFQIGGGFGKGGSTHGSAFYGLGGLGGPGGMARGKVGHGGVRGGVVSAPSHGARTSGGLLPMEAVRRVVDQHISEVQECYENGLLRSPGLSGKLVVEWTISLTGTVSRVNTKVATLQSNQVSDCIIQHLKGWRFPRPTGGTVIVSYPFIFKSVGG